MFGHNQSCDHKRRCHPRHTKISPPIFVEWFIEAGRQLDNRYSCRSRVLQGEAGIHQWPKTLPWDLCKSGDNVQQKDRWLKTSICKFNKKKNLYETVLVTLNLYFWCDKSNICQWMYLKINIFSITREFLKTNLWHFWTQWYLKKTLFCYIFHQNRFVFNGAILLIF